MKKRIIVIVVCIALLFTAIGVGVGASILASANNLTQDDIRFLRGYAGEKGDWSIEGNKINLNGSGVVSSAQKLVWDPSTTTNAGVVFTVTYNQAYTELSATDGDADYFANYRFAVALMDSQHFQGESEGNGLGVEYRLNSATGAVRNMGFYYKGESDLGLKYPGRNLGLSASATEGMSIQCKITYESGKWKIWVDKDGKDGIDSLVAEFNPNDSYEGENAQYFPTNLFSGGKAYLVFGSYNANKMNMSITIDQTYGGFSFTNDVTYTDTVTRVGENIALEDNILTRFYVKYSSYDMIAKGGNVNLTCGDKSVNYELIDGTLLEGLTYGYTIPVPAALGTETITLTVQSDALDGEENPVWSGTWSTTVKDYCDTLKANNAGTDDKSVALRALCDSINDYCSKAKAYFDLVNDSN
ncbi:MAG: hypothetical protein IJZ83_02615 [Clostridia bacterium]|nr:hypothetical protein [Clostridia bacterium]